MTARLLTGAKISTQMLPPALPVLWSKRRANDNIRRLHQVHYRAIWKSRSFVGKAGLIICLACWPILILPHVLHATVRNGRLARQETGKSFWRQACDQVVLAARFGFRPEGYYKLEFYRPARMAEADCYVNRNATKDSLYRLLKAKEENWSPLTDKVTFAKYCIEHGINVSPIVASLRRGQIDVGFAGLPQADLFVKRSRGRGGVKAELWRFQDGRYRNGDGTELGETALLADIARRSTKEPYLIQRRLTNDTRLRDLALDALATVRCVTAIAEDGTPEPIRAVFRMPSRERSIVDNFHAGGIAAAIDLVTGQLAQATDMGLAPSIGWVDCHPVTGARIAGRVLPDWPEMLAVVLDAHRAFADRPIIGWDVALTTDGIIIVEGNAAADTDIIQRCHRAPLGQTRYVDLMLWHLERLGRLF